MKIQLRSAPLRRLVLGLLCAAAACSPAPTPTRLAPTRLAASPTPAAQPTPTPPPAPTPISGISWPADQYLPAFAAFDTLETVDLTQGVGSDEITLFAGLQGLVNRAQPRIYLIYAAEEGPSTWLDELKAVRREPVADRWSLFTRYKDEIQGIVVYNPAAPDTINLATTISGLQNGLPASPALAARLAAEPYGFKVLEDLSSLTFESRAAAYQYAYERYGAKVNHRLTISLDPAIAGNLRDYAVALGGLVIWLDPRVAAEEALLAKILNDAPPTAPFVGYFPNPTNGGEGVIIRYLSQHARPSFAMDVFQNATVFGGVPPSRLTQTIPPKPALENKVYVTFFISDGDNLQYIQHKMRLLWADPRRGQVPIGWTFQPAIADVAPNMLDYYLASASPLDVLVAGPSGLGYTYPNDWTDGEALTRYAQLTDRYMTRLGLRVITLWDAGSNALNPSAASIYSAEMPSLLGVTHQNWLNFGAVDNRLAQIGLHPAYGDSAYMLQRSLSTAALAAGWNAEAPTQPVFVAAQVNAWAMTPTDLYTVMQSLQAENPGMVFVRPDHFFMLAREANGLPVDPRP